MTATPEPPTDPPKVERKQCNIRLPVDLIEDIDTRRAKKDLSRDRWVENALRFALAQHPAPPRPTGRINR